jgi:simple sugar transport system permease protein
MLDRTWAELVPAVWFAAAAYAGPLILAALGETLSERSGVLNLGLEGVLAAGALAGFGISAETGSAWLGLGAGAMAGLLLGAVHAALVVELGADQIVAGLGMTLGATGTAAFLGPLWLAAAGDPAYFSELSRDRLPLPLGYPPTTVLALAATGLAAWVLSRRRLGLAIRAAGDAPEAALALGLPVRAIRWGCVLAGSALGGLAGATLTLAYAHTWTSTMPNGMGWIVIALVPLSAWRPWRVLTFCVLLAAVGALQLRLQTLGVRLSSSLLALLPYLTTLIAVVAGKVTPQARSLPTEPAALGKPLEP